MEFKAHDTPLVWCGMYIPHMPGRYGMYNECNYAPQNLMPEFKSFVSNHELLTRLSDVSCKEDLLKHKNLLTNLQREMNSPSCCFFDMDERVDTFYSDQQGCVKWIIDDQGQVCVKHGPCVATSVQDFLARWLIECNLYHKTLQKKTFSIVETQYQKASVDASSDNSDDDASDDE